MEEEECLPQEESAWADELDVDMSQLCRICANPNEYLIPIFHGEGKEHELEEKISKHLPIKVAESDTLPTNLCYQCASTLIAWHDMVVGCIEADDKLKSVSSKDSKITDEITKNDTEVEQDSNSQQVSVPEMQINNTAYILQEQEPELTSSVNEENVIEEIIPADKFDVIEDKTADSRCLGSFKSYHQTQIALRMLQWANRSSVYCVICGTKRENQTLLIKHLYIEHKMQCGHCGVRFTSEPQLRNHMVTHGNSAVYKCDICSLSFLDRFSLKKHKIKSHSKVFELNKENGDSNTKCTTPKLKLNNANDKHAECNTSWSEDKACYTDSDDSVKEEYTSKDLFVKAEIRLCESKFSCAKCDFTCDLKRDMIYHRDNNHKSNKNEICQKGKPHQCDICSNSFLRKADLQRHIYKIHFEDEFKKNSSKDMYHETINRAKENIDGVIVYRCGICGKHLRTKKGFVRHTRVHTGERPFTCHICGKQYRSNTDLTRHLRCVHEGVKKYQCDICGQSFANKATTNDHRRTHTGEKPFMCDVCGKSFPTPNSIYIHRRIHMNYFPHECNTCEKKFRRKQQLIHHSRTHTGEKPHTCNVCGKCFAVKDEVTRHKRTHSSEKSHVCPHCGFAFAQKRYLTSHIKTHHSGLL